VSWVLDHIGQILSLAGQHAYLAGVPLLLGLLLALPLGWLARRYPRFYPPLIVGTGLMYTIPSLALFILLPLVIGTEVISPTNVLVAMTIYTVALLVRTVADGLGSVPEVVNQAATAMGYRRVARFFTVELPLAVPVIAAGLRVAAVSNVSIVSVASLIGVSQLGYLLSDGYQRGFATELVVGIVACVVLALVFDGLIVLAGRLMTPWVRLGRVGR
jgi:osmoprotectant transport system permease protein